MSDCHEALDCPDTLTELELAPEIEEGGGASLAYALNPGDVETGERQRSASGKRIKSGE